ncbi:MAG: hypothetical protein ACK5LZ_00145 [Anaerorhabdus sp.]
MASIAYITEKQRIEFHRLNGDTKMNFCRAGKIRNFTDFAPGDLLFFLAKGSERGKKREKGIVGYGTFKKEIRQSVKKMWKEFGQSNGFASEELFKKALTKNGEVQKQVQGLYLEDVVFFQFPIYLSEFNFQLSSKAEGYVYIDKDDQQITSKILQQANESGVDAWTVALQHEEIVSLEEDKVKHQVSLLYKKIKDVGYTDSEKRKAMKLSKALVERRNYDYIKGSKMDCIQFQNEKVWIAIPFVYNKKNMEQRTQLLLGHCLGYCLGMKKGNANVIIQFKILTHEPLVDSIKKNIESLNEWNHGK